jgi:hypothetical protein
VCKKDREVEFSATMSKKVTSSSHAAGVPLQKGELMELIKKKGGGQRGTRRKKTALVDDLIEWRNVVIASSGSSVWTFTAFIA